MHNHDFLISNTSSTPSTATSEKNPLLKNTKKLLGRDGYHSIEIPPPQPMEGSQAHQIGLDHQDETSISQSHDQRTIPLQKVGDISILSYPEITQIAQDLNKKGSFLLERNPKSIYQVTLTQEEGAREPTSQVQKLNRSLLNAIKSQFSHGIAKGHFYTRAVRIHQELQHCLGKIASRQVALRAINQAIEETDQLEIPDQKLPHLYPLQGDLALKLLNHNPIETSIMHSGIQETIALDAPSDKPSIQLTPAAILIFGIHQSREKMINELYAHTDLPQKAPLFVMNQLNSSLGIDRTNIFVRLFQIKSRNLRLSQPLIESFSQDYPEGTQEEKKEKFTQLIKEWEKFLYDHFDRFDFSKKLLSDKWISFFFKNIELDPNSTLGRIMLPKATFSAAKLEQAKEYLRPIRTFLFQILEAIKTATNEEDFKKACSEIYPSWEQFSAGRQKIIITIFFHAFWRKTSKLGLSFAAEQEIPVLFSWQVPGQENNPAAMSDRLQAAPLYKETLPHFYEGYDSSLPTSQQATQYYQKRITFSELAEIVRLFHQAKQESSKKSLQFLLIQKIRLIGPKLTRTEMVKIEK